MFVGAIGHPIAANLVSLLLYLVTLETKINKSRNWYRQVIHLKNRWPVIGQKTAVGALLIEITKISLRQYLLWVFLMYLTSRMDSALNVYT